MKKLTRRDVISGTVGAAIGAAAVYENRTIPMATSPEMQSPAVQKALDEGMRIPAPVPNDQELRQWETIYKARYRTAHRARNQAILDLHMDDEPLRLDLAAAKVEAELEGAFALVFEEGEYA